ncbi:hypothetical protein ACFPQ1_32885 [Rhodocytophaga aerolata]|uniref:hypothetical protein n=1 Tax=Rhodocytophaga aerolata TaxID=455078 RepID=UPI0036213D78
MDSFTNRAPAHFPQANQALGVLKEQGVSTETGIDIHWVIYQKKAWNNLSTNPVNKR